MEGTKPDDCCGGGLLGRSDRRKAYGCEEEISGWAEDPRHCEAGFKRMISRPEDAGRRRGISRSIDEIVLGILKRRRRSSHAEEQEVGGVGGGGGEGRGPAFSAP